MILRAPEYSDLDLLFALENDPQQWITSNTRAPFSRAALKQFIVRSAQYDIFALRQQRFVIELGDEGKEVAIGFVDLTDFSPEHHRAEVGILLLPAYRGQGYGKRPCNYSKPTRGKSFHCKTYMLSCLQTTLPHSVCFERLPMTKSAC